MQQIWPLEQSDDPAQVQAKVWQSESVVQRVPEYDDQHTGASGVQVPASVGVGTPRVLQGNPELVPVSAPELLPETSWAESAAPPSAGLEWPELLEQCALRTTVARAHHGTHQLHARSMPTLNGHPCSIHVSIAWGGSERGGVP
jgi:hypothetical protein